ncbi:Ger(x)C family spore germination protein [Brevibacillus sp. B_LB10_24]|uniref:Ger(x)C family spore germination protein n=1 Tax=Brevibacillus sp. B_LB10_24 TaxID=3380645 RepID=UPI0038BC4BE2
MKLLRFLLFCQMVLLLTGCWDRREVNDLAIVTAAGVDKKTGKTIELSVQVYIPKAAGAGPSGMGGGGGSGTAPQTLVRSAVGVTIAEAMAKLQEQIPRKIFWGHNDVFIIDEKLAKEGIRPYIDFLLRHPQTRERAFVFISKETSREILSLNPPLEKNIADVLRELAKFQIGMKVTIKDLAQMLAGNTRAAAAPRIIMLSPEEGEDEKKTIAYEKGSAIFKKDKLVGFLDDKLTRGVLWLRNEIKSTTITIAPKEAKGFVSMQLLRSTAEIIPKIKDDEWSITVKLETEDDIVQNTTNLDTSNPKVTRLLAKHMEEDIKNRVKMVLAQVQKKMKADIFGFGEAFHRKYPKEWDEVKDRWDEVFPKVKVNIRVKVWVRRPGLVTEQADMPKKEVKKE